MLKATHKAPSRRGKSEIFLMHCEEFFLWIAFEEVLKEWGLLGAVIKSSCIFMRDHQNMMSSLQFSIYFYLKIKKIQQQIWWMILFDVCSKASHGDVPYELLPPCICIRMHLHAIIPLNHFASMIIKRKAPTAQFHFILNKFYFYLLLALINSFIVRHYNK